MSDCSTCGGCSQEKKTVSVDSELIIKVLTKAIEHKLHFNKGHGERIARMSKWLSNYLGIDSEMSELVSVAGYLHDIGMLSMSEGILDKSGPLTDGEWEEIRKHPENGMTFLGGYEDLREVQLMVKDHHEKFDGTGYPNGTKGDEIHLGARIIALCEAIDTMSTEQPYKSTMNFEAIEVEVRNQSGKHFDPWLVMHIKELLIIWQETYSV